MSALDCGIAVGAVGAAAFIAAAVNALDELNGVAIDVVERCLRAL